MSFVPEIVITKTENPDRITKSVWFEWRGVSQFAEMTWESNGGWLITQTNYSEAFSEWLDENLNDFDSLESLFGVEVEV